MSVPILSPTMLLSCMYYASALTSEIWVFLLWDPHFPVSSSSKAYSLAYTKADKAKLCPYGHQRVAPAVSSRHHYRHFAQHIRECSKAGCEYTKSSTLSSFPQCHVMHILCQGALKAKRIRNAWLGSWVSSVPYFFSSSPTFVSLQGTRQKKQSSSLFTTFLLLFHILRLLQISC